MGKFPYTFKTGIQRKTYGKQDNRPTSGTLIKKMILLDRKCEF